MLGYTAKKKAAMSPVRFPAISLPASPPSAIEPAPITALHSITSTFVRRPITAGSHNHKMYTGGCSADCVVLCSSS